MYKENDRCVLYIETGHFTGDHLYPASGQYVSRWEGAVCGEQLGPLGEQLTTMWGTSEHSGAVYNSAT